jgi:predicted ATPase
MKIPQRLIIALILAQGITLTGATALAQSSTEVEPDITIRQEEDRIIREYRANGQLYAIEIRPANGPAYYLVDQEGDGNFVRDEGDRIAVPQWVLKRF